MTEEEQYYASKGGWNRAALEWFYITTGLNTFNDFKYVFATIVGIYLTVHYPYIAAGVALLFLPALRIIGSIKVKHIAKRLDWLGVIHTTHWSKKGYDMQQRKIELLEQILEKLK